ncbi:MAG: F0F1 ATP synthase subunit B [Pseudomonadota bacterium]
MANQGEHTSAETGGSHIATNAEVPHTGMAAVEDPQGGIGHGNHPDPRALMLDGTGWVSLAMAVFIGVLLWKGVPKLIGGMLDKQIAAIRGRLDDAKALRAEAEALRDEYARKIAAVEQESAAIVAHAEEEAKAVVAKAEQDAADLVLRRARMAEDKIAAAERAALADVRSKAADAAARAAGTLLAAKVDAEADRALIDKTISGLARLN